MIRLFVGKARRWSLIGAGAILLLIVVGGWLGYRASSNADMLRLLPDDLPKNAGLYSFAVLEGKGVFAQNCASCHGADLKGSRITGVPNLTDTDWIYGDGRLAEIEQLVVWGIRSGPHRSKNFADMPAFGRQHPYKRYDVAPLKPDEIEDIANYVGKFHGQPADPASIERGKALFDNRGQCFDCHDHDLGGDNYIGAPNLKDAFWLYGDGSHKAIVSSITMGRAGVMPMFRNRLSAAQIRAVSAFIHDQSKPRPAA